MQEMNSEEHQFRIADQLQKQLFIRQIFHSRGLAKQFILEVNLALVSFDDFGREFPIYFPQNSSIESQLCFFSWISFSIFCIVLGTSAYN
ncbi:hypothetical protein FGO68_gene5111 [Halteria grandinella]|uniref:Uncharacterized protein n=1 Tax=Halteria grandinella TaxID=5974 RepID=A0A8J8T133_HALGN|nr:hypothetical protein FGO68_gene5111 [Halteria grandinella]